MRNILRDELIAHLSKSFKAERKRHSKIKTQAKMSEALYMEVRPYSDIERGESLCSLITFLLFLELLPDPMSEVETILEIVKKGIVEYNKKSDDQDYN